MPMFSRSCCLFVIAAAMMHSHADAQEAPMVQQDSVAVSKVVADWSIALKTRDVKMLEQIMADDYVTTNADGSVSTKEEEIAPFRSPGMEFDTATVQSMSVTLYGTMAIVRGTGYYTGKSKWGTFSSSERFTDVFLKRNGKWQAISSHSSALRKKKP